METKELKSIVARQSNQIENLFRLNQSGRGYNP
jgi:hypothetical protein